MNVFAEFTIHLKKKRVGKTSPNYLDGATLAPSTVNKRIFALKLLLERTRKYKMVGIDPAQVEMSKEK